MMKPLTGVMTDCIVVNWFTNYMTMPYTLNYASLEN